MVLQVPNWVIEDSAELLDGSPDAVYAPFYHAPAIENQEAETLWYHKFFRSKEHQNYLGIDENSGPFALSILREETQLRAILWLNQGAETIIMPTKGLKSNLSASEVMKKINPNISKKKLREVKATGIQEELLKLEARNLVRSKYYKFGVLYSKAGQKTEEEMFNNRHGSDEFNKFLAILGEKVALKNFEGYSAGLDTRFDRTGKNSIYTNYCGYEVMFHVSTLLPYTESDPQQVERKRHIGNDIVIIIFQDHDAREPVSPLIISSRFPHVYAVVRALDKQVSGFSVSLCTRDTLKSFGPPLPSPAIFTDPTIFKNFMLAKLINGEREAIRSAPDFRSSDVLYQFLKEIYDKFPKSLAEKRSTSYSDLKDFAGSPGNLTVSASSPTLDLAAVPTEFAAAAKVQPAVVSAFAVKPVLVFSKQVNCCDTLANTLVLGTNDGLYVFDPLKPGTTIDEKTVRVNAVVHSKVTIYKQLDVIDSLGILITLIPKVGVVVYDSSSLVDEDGPAEFRVDRTKGATRYSIGTIGESLYICCYVKNDLLLIRWEEDRFVPSHAIHINTEPSCIHFWNSRLVVGVDSNFDLINPDPDRPTSHLLFAAPSKESKSLDIIVLQDELLLCFSNIGIFVNSEGQKTRNFDVKWNSVPTSFVYVYPYILAITPINIEVRTIVNGNLIQSIAPDQNASDLVLLTTSQGVFYGGKLPGGSIICQLKLAGPPPAASKKSSIPRRTTSPNLNYIPPVSIVQHVKQPSSGQAGGGLPPRSKSSTNVKLPDHGSLDDSEDDSHGGQLSRSSTSTSSPREDKDRIEPNRTKGDPSAVASPSGHRRQATNTSTGSGQSSGESPSTPPNLSPSLEPKHPRDGSRPDHPRESSHQRHQSTPTGPPKHSDDKSSVFVDRKISRRKSVQITPQQLARMVKPLDPSLSPRSPPSFTRTEFTSLPSSAAATSGAKSPRSSSSKRKSKRRNSDESRKRRQQSPIRGREQDESPERRLRSLPVKPRDDASTKTAQQILNEPVTPEDYESDSPIRIRVPQFSSKYYHRQQENSAGSGSSESSPKKLHASSSAASVTVTTTSAPQGSDTIGGGVSKSSTTPNLRLPERDASPTGQSTKTRKTPRKDKEKDKRGSESPSHKTQGDPSPSSKSRRQKSMSAAPPVSNLAPTDAPSGGSSSAENSPSRNRHSTARSSRREDREEFKRKSSKDKDKEKDRVDSEEKDSPDLSRNSPLVGSPLDKSVL